MTPATVENRGSSTPITDAVYGRKPPRKRKAERVQRNPRHTFTVGAGLTPETFTALETLKGELAKPKRRRKGGRR